MSSKEKVRKNEEIAVRHNARASNGELSERQYQHELHRLHVDLVKLQLWAVHKGLKACIIFEGRDGAGKGGTIRAVQRSRLGLGESEMPHAAETAVG